MSDFEAKETAPIREHVDAILVFARDSLENGDLVGGDVANILGIRDEAMRLGRAVHEAEREKNSALYYASRTKTPLRDFHPSQVYMLIDALESLTEWVSKNAVHAPKAHCEESCMCGLYRVKRDAEMLLKEVRRVGS